jgi:dUTP pyrophosphatase
LFTNKYYNLLCKQNNFLKDVSQIFYVLIKEELYSNNNNNNNNTNNQKMFLVQKLSPNAKLPTKATTGSAGYDLYAAEDVTIGNGQNALVKTDIAIKMPKGYYGRVASRSSLAWRSSLEVGAGVIDEDYRGPVNVLLFYRGVIGNSLYRVNKGDRIAQLILTKYCEDEILLEVSSLDETDRGTGGFGSTGFN